jgi:hypothetical protein
MLAAVAIAWTAYPLAAGGLGIRVLLIVAIASAVLGTAQLVLLAVPRASAMGFATIPERSADLILGFIRALPWAEILLVALLVLEALHPARPWHTGVLGIALLAYLFAIHLAETDARPAALRPQLPVIAAGIGLLALAIGAAALPALGAGPTATAIRIAAIVATVIVAMLAVPADGSGTA